MPLPGDWEYIAFDNLSGDESLTDELPDEPASRLLNWALRQVPPMAELTSEELQVGDVLGRVRRIARAVNRLVGRLSTLSRDAISFRLERLIGYYTPLLNQDELEELRKRLQNWAETATGWDIDRALDEILAALDLAAEPPQDANDRRDNESTEPTT